MGMGKNYQFRHILIIQIDLIGKGSERMESVIQVRNEYRKQQWTQIIRECQSSGLSNKEYCRQHGISEKNYYYWLRKLRSAAAEGIPQIVEIEPPAMPICLNTRPRRRC